MGTVPSTSSIGLHTGFSLSMLIWWLIRGMFPRMLYIVPLARDLHHRLVRGVVASIYLGAGEHCFRGPAHGELSQQELLKVLVCRFTCGVVVAHVADDAHISPRLIRNT